MNGSWKDNEKNLLDRGENSNDPVVQRSQCLRSEVKGCDGLASAEYDVQLRHTADLHLGFIRPYGCQNCDLDLGGTRYVVCGYANREE